MNKFLSIFTLFHLSILGALEVVPEKHYYTVGETAVFNISLGGKRGAKIIDVKIHGSRDVSRELRLKTDDSGKAKLEVPLYNPGFICVQITDNGKDAFGGIAVDKEKILPARQKPAEFEAFWSKIKAELDHLAMQYELNEIPAKSGFKAYEVKLILGGEGKDVDAVLTMPEKSVPGRSAAIALFHGHGIDRVSPVYKKDVIVISVNPLPVKHDGKCGVTIRDPKGKYYMYRHWGADDLEKNSFVAMFRRNYRALQFLKSLPEWDQRTLIVFGASQGGAQALAAAGMDPQVTFCGALVPALCNHGGFDAGAESGWPRYHETEAYQNDPDKSLKVIDFVDAAFFAANIRDAEVFVSAGFIDRTCVPSSVYAAYNVIPAEKKEMHDELCGGHQTRKKAYEKLYKLVDEHIKKMQSGFNNSVRQ